MGIGDWTLAPYMEIPQSNFYIGVIEPDAFCINEGCIFDGNYILKTMNKNINYFGIFENEKLVALASSEMDLVNLNTEMTDFATLHEYRGNNFSFHLLKEMEKDAKAKGIKTAYTIARAKSTGINMTFTKMDYEFGGTLINNTNICGNIETMNVWYKTLS